jgi:hypothetical protein
VFFKLLLVLALVAGLGDKDFRARERAQRALTELNNGCDFRPLLRGFVNHPDPEVADRVGRVLASYDAVWGGMTEAPKLSSFDRYLYPGNFDLAWLVVTAAAQIRGDEEYCYPSDDDLRSATHAYVSYLLRSGVSRQRVRGLIDEAVKKEAPLPTPTPREVSK